MKRSLEMPVADRRTDRRTDVGTYEQDRLYRTPVGSAGGPKNIVKRTLFKEILTTIKNVLDFISLPGVLNQQVRKI